MNTAQGNGFQDTSSQQNADSKPVSGIGGLPAQGQPHGQPQGQNLPQNRAAPQRESQGQTMTGIGGIDQAQTQAQVHLEPASVGADVSADAPVPAMPEPAVSDGVVEKPTIHHGQMDPSLVDEQKLEKDLARNLENVQKAGMKAADAANERVVVANAASEDTVDTPKDAVPAVAAANKTTAPADVVVDTPKTDTVGNESKWATMTPSDIARPVENTTIVNDDVSDFAVPSAASKVSGNTESVAAASPVEDTPAGHTPVAESPVAETPDKLAVSPTAAGVPDATLSSEPDAETLMGGLISSKAIEHEKVPADVTVDYPPKYSGSTPQDDDSIPTTESAQDQKDLKNVEAEIMAASAAVAAKKVSDSVPAEKSAAPAQQSASEVKPVEAEKVTAQVSEVDQAIEPTPQAEPTSPEGPTVEEEKLTESEKQIEPEMATVAATTEPTAEVAGGEAADSKSGKLTGKSKQMMLWSLYAFAIGVALLGVVYFLYTSRQDEYTLSNTESLSVERSTTVTDGATTGIPSGNAEVPQDQAERLSNLSRPDANSGIPGAVAGEQAQRSPTSTPPAVPPKKEPIEEEVNEVIEDELVDPRGVVEGNEAMDDQPSAIGSFETSEVIDGMVMYKSAELGVKFMVPSGWTPCDASYFTAETVALAFYAIATCPTIDVIEPKVIMSYSPEPLAYLVDEATNIELVPADDYESKSMTFTQYEVTDTDTSETYSMYAIDVPEDQRMYLAVPSEYDVAEDEEVEAMLSSFSII